ncbi:MAG TPA: hypothetical protein PK048_03865 [Candidatus Absconditabacterales bacterium]|nr:hypothetical protein [Candidatus Absconditabacterales bacterium]
MTDPIIQTKTCRHCQKSFDITQGDLDFYDKISRGLPGYQESPHGEGEGSGVRIPTPTLCPECRQRRRLSFRNERNLYRRTCDASGKQIISIYSPDKPYKVYDQKIWWSDSRDPMSYGRDFNFTRSFTEQFGELMKEVPQLPLINDDGRLSENCTFTNDFALGKNCYMCFHMGEAENDLYCYFCNTSKELIDCNIVTGGSSYSYECIIGSNLYKCKYLIKSINCNECLYGVQLSGCSNCFGCYGLQNKQYCINNEQHTKEEYFQRIKHLEKEDFKKYFFTIPGVIDLIKKPYIINSQSYEGDNLINCNQCTGTNLFNCNGVKYADGCDRLIDCYDVFSVRKSEGCYEGVTPDNGYQVQHSIYSWNCINTIYTVSCHNSSHLFGCVGLRNKSYCIFNKQYTKQEYEELVPKIIAHMESTGERGEFFHPSLSPFGYNETVAQEYFPLQSITDSSEGLEIRDLNNSINFGTFGYHRSTYEAPKPVSDNVIQGKDLPAHIEEVDDSILQSAIACEVTGKLFRIQPQELVFYRKHNIPLPHKHPDQRHLERLALRR